MRKNNSALRKEGKLDQTFKIKFFEEFSTILYSHESIINTLIELQSTQELEGTTNDISKELGEPPI